MNKHVLLAVFLLAGCAASGPTYSSLNNDQILPTKGDAKIVVFRESTFINSTARFWVEINGIEVCKLHNASFLIHEMQPGKVAIASSNFGSYGTSRITVDAKPNATTYVKMAMNGNRVTSGVLGGAIANTVDEGIEENSGPVYLGEVSAANAKAEMAGFNLEEGCK